MSATTGPKWGPDAIDLIQGCPADRDATISDEVQRGETEHQLDSIWNRSIRAPTVCCG